MKEALKPIIDYGFNQMKLNRIEALIAPNNIPSLKLIKHFNFKEEGLLKNHYLKDGVYEDSLFFGLLAHEYQDKN
jgi:ribosomal-protein-alanine N-acetyltransferase